MSATFHGRDVFAPVAARLAGGAPLASAGAPLDPGELVALERTEPRQEAGRAGRARGRHRRLTATRRSTPPTTTWWRAASSSATRSRRAPARAACAASWRARSRDVGAGRAAALRGRGRRARARGQRRRRRRAARAAGRRRGAAGGRVTLGRPRLHLRETTSTNERRARLAAARRAARHARDRRRSRRPAADARAGRGRRPPGSALLLSLIVREPDPLLPLRAGLAVADLAGPAARVKWPNDVLRRRPQGRRRARRGAAAGGLGGASGSASTPPSTPDELPPELQRGHARPAPGRARGDAGRAARARWTAAWPSPPTTSLAALRERDALLDRAAVVAGRRGRRRGDRRARPRCACAGPTASRCSTPARCTSSARAS